MPQPKKKQKKKGQNQKKKGHHNQNQKGGKKNKKNQQKKSNNNKKNHQDEEKENYNKVEIRGIEVMSKEKYTGNGQTFPPSKTVKELWLNKEFEANQIMSHPGTDGKKRMNSSEKVAKENELLFQQRLRDIREASEVHRSVRNAAQLFIKPGRTMVEICEFIERSSSKLVGFDSSFPMKRGWGFPTGCSLNECAAHYTPNSGDITKLKKKDLCKIDFGVQINGNIIDCAFSLSFDPMHDTLMKAVKAATNRGIEVMGIDARLGEIGGEIQEVMESFECTYDNKIYPVKCIRNLNGHSIGPYIIHGGKTVPIVKTNDQTKMEENELFAIETFGSTGKGVVYSDGECSHFALVEEQLNNKHYIQQAIHHKGAKDLYKYINKRFGTIPFCRRWLDDDGQKRHLMSLKQLVDNEIVRAYPPLCDIKGSYTAQYEHTIWLKPTSKEVVSRGTDF